METARPVAFELQILRATELNYPGHEKELLAVVRALGKWHSDLLGVHFTVLTDYHTLKDFEKQKDLSRCQVCWQEFLGQYNYMIQYVKGVNNALADAMSRKRHSLPLEAIVATV